MRTIQYFLLNFVMIVDEWSCAFMHIPPDRVISSGKVILSPVLGHLVSQACTLRVPFKAYGTGGSVMSGNSISTAICFRDKNRKAAVEKLTTCAWYVSILSNKKCLMYIQFMKPHPGNRCPTAHVRTMRDFMRKPMLATRQQKEPRIRQVSPDGTQEND